MNATAWPRADEEDYAPAKALFSFVGAPFSRERSWEDETPCSQACKNLCPFSQL